MTGDRETVENLLSNEARLNSVIASHVQVEDYEALERQAVAQLASLGRQVTGWEYDDGSEFESASVRKDKFDQRAGLHGGELAMLMQTMLLMDFQTQLDSLKTTVQFELCGRLDYCRSIKALSDREKDWTALESFGEWLIKECLHLTFPPLALVVFLVKRGILDRWCECDKQHKAATTAAKKIPRRCKRK